MTKATRVNTAIQVFQHMNSGMTVVEACKTVGMPRSSFYYIIDRNPDAFAEARALIDANNREQLVLILMEKTEILCKLIEDGLSEKTKPRDRLAIYIELSDLVEKLTDSLQIENRQEKDALSFLNRGPTLIRGTSRFSAT